MRKACTVIAATGLALFALAGCSSGNGSNPDSAKGATATPGSATPDGTNDTTDASKANDSAIKPEPGASLLLWEDPGELPFAKEMAAAFKQKYNVDVKVETIAAPDQADRLANDGPAKLAADVVMFPHDKLGTAVTAGLLLPNDVFAKETRATTGKAALEAASYNGKLYGYPKSVETYALLYNKDLVKELPKTWDDIVTFSNKFSDKDKKKYGIMWEAKLLYFNYMFIAANGGYLFGKDGTDPNDIGLNNDGAVTGFKYFQSIRDILPVKVENLTYDVKTELFQQGKVAFNIDGPWSLGSFKGKVNLGAMALPDLPGGKKSISFSGVRSYYVNSYTKYPNAAKLLASFMTTKENAMKNFKLTGILPANTEAAKDPEIADDPLLGGFMKQFESSQPMPSISQIDNVWKPMEGATTAIWNDNADVKKKLDEAVKTIKDQIAAGRIQK